MKTFIIALALIGCASAATVESIKNDLKKFVNSTRDSTVDELQAVIGPFYDDAKTCNTFFSKVQLGTSSKAFEAVIAYIKQVRTNDTIMTKILDPRLNESRTKIDIMYSQATVSVAASACPAKVISSLSKFSSALQTKVKAAVRDVRKQWEATYKGYEQKFMNDNFGVYEGQVKFCSKSANLKNPDCLYLQEESLAVTGLYMAETLRSSVESFIDNYLSQTADAINYPENVDIDFENALNVACK